MKELIHNCETGETIEREFTAEETTFVQADATDRAWRTLREDRNRLLAESDWTVLSDTPTSTAAWKVYRQALRDLPSNTTDPFQPVWPTPPS